MHFWPLNMSWFRIRWSWSLPATFILFFVAAGAPFPELAPQIRTVA
ncbi:hypothetical protein [Bradyrhizobium liaoningense]